MPCREYAECKARELQRTRKEAEEAEKQLLKLAKDIQYKVPHFYSSCLAPPRAVIASFQVVQFSFQLTVRPGVALHCGSRARCETRGSAHA